ncbi:ribonuclease H-like domain-containing protein, partial [Tanacetum coccineum]
KVLSAQWDRCIVVVLTLIMNYVSSVVYMGLVYSVDVAFVWKELESTYDKSVRSALLTSDPLFEVKALYTTVSREESHKGIPESSGVIGSKLNVTSFVAKTFNNEDKLTREPFHVSDHKSKKLGELIHLDLWGPRKVSTRERFKYFLTIVDDISRVVWVYMLKTKDEVFEIYSSFVKMIHNKFDVGIKTIRSDNGTEFINKKNEWFVK